MAAKAIQKQWKQLTNAPVPNCSAGPCSEDDLFHWEAVIIGADDTPYAGGVFHVDIHFPDEYPLKAPKVKFTTKIYHCNVTEHGWICLDILYDNWSPAISISSLLLCIFYFLTDCNPDDCSRFE
jgi:ubiquitin-conjugating enzyme E2 D/E